MQDNRSISNPHLKHTCTVPSPCKGHVHRSSALGRTPWGSLLSASELGPEPLPVQLPALEPLGFSPQDKRTPFIDCYLVVMGARKELGGILFNVIHLRP